MNFMKSIDDIFHRNFLKASPFILVFSLLMLTFSSISRVFSILSFLIIMINALYILGKILIYKTSKRSVE
ncbi:hypothetical protein PWYN_06315 [Paenibacillus wynnii]|uniref:Uncharacterized protein n=1 Tax=Paenibacillus wynnii TaxID=268407 RepID=A0A098MAC2_9BACL|nr:hypothetical protein PWYN_06315 [Paenibacillus wynnii]